MKQHDTNSVLPSMEGDIALITGGNSGIGRATALKFASLGAKVIISARRVREAEETMDLIRRNNGDCLFIKTDVTIPRDVHTMMKTIIRKYSRLDYAFNNAGILGIPIVKTHEISELDWDKMIDVNLKGIWLCMKYQLSEMIKTGKGCIVNMSSIAGLVARPSSIAAYTSSKHGVIGLTKTAALEYAQHGIRINAICPGGVLTTPMRDLFNIDPMAESNIINNYPTGRLATEEEIASCAVWLCSEKASFVTGHALTVDGGLTSH